MPPAVALLSIMIGLAAFMGTAAAQALPDLGGRKITVVAENAYPPLQSIDPGTGEAIGWEYDAMAELARRLNLKVEYRTTGWDVMIEAVSQGGFDVGMNGIAVRDDRGALVDFSDPYMHSEMVMLVRGDETRFTDAASFRAFTPGLVGVQAGTTPFHVAVSSLLASSEANPRLKLFGSFAASVQALTAGAVDVVLTDATAGRGYAETSSGALKLIGAPLGSEDFAFIFRKGSDLVAPFNEAIAALRADGTFATLDRKWLRSP